MKCNQCSAEMLNAYYIPEYPLEQLGIYNESGYNIGYMQYCPKCGNLQVNLKEREIDGED